MRILFLTPQLPYPPHQGTQIRNFHLLKAAASAHHVDLISFAREGESLDAAAPIRGLCREVKLLPAPRRNRVARLQTLVTSSLPDLAHRLRSNGFGDTLRVTLAGGRYDIVQVAGLEMAGYFPIVRTTAPGARLVFDDHNAEHLLQARAAAVDARTPAAWPRAAYSLVQWLRLRRYEAWACGAADTVLTVSEDDARALQRLGSDAPLRVVPNGVDTSYYGSAFGPRPGTDGLLFTGTMDYRPNVDAMTWFATAILPRIAAERPEVSLQIVGRSPAPAVARLASRHRSVTVTGPVEDVRPYFSRSSVFIVPIRMAGGARLKILEALAMGMPIVSTRLGAEGIDLIAGEEILLADSADDFASAVLRLLGDRDLQARLAAAGRRAAAERFDWRRVAPRLLMAYRDGEGRPGEDEEVGREP